MKLAAKFMGKTTEVTLTDRAKSELAKRIEPVHLEMELYFSCLVRKRVYEVTSQKDRPISASVNELLQISFKPVVTNVCVITPESEEPPPQVSESPVINPKRFIPGWLKIDYRDNKWCGDFGYKKAIKSI